MKIFLKLSILFIATTLFFGCKKNENVVRLTAEDILGNPAYLAMSYGGFRENTRDIVPTIEEIKDDMKILNAMGVKIIRTYNTKIKEVPNLLEAISQLNKENPNFEMYVMLGAWIDCENAWTENPNHNAEDVVANTGEIDRAVALTNQYPDIVKIIAVGNEAMVHWAGSYFVGPDIILKWVNHLQQLKKEEKLPTDLWITSSDNFASWGGGDKSYHIEDLTKLITAVDFISLHTYPFHDTHYNSSFWDVPESEKEFSEIEKVNSAMLRAKNYAISQYQSTADFIDSLGIQKPIHIGETGWSTKSNSLYGINGSNAADEYKEKLYYNAMREWTNKVGVSCFYFEAFDEKWKDAQNPLGSENHFGLINLKGEAKYVLWDLVDAGTFKGLLRNNKSIIKSYNGDETILLNELFEN